MKAFRSIRSMIIILGFVTTIEILTSALVTSEIPIITDYITAGVIASGIVNTTTEGEEKDILKSTIMDGISGSINSISQLASLTTKIIDPTIGNVISSAITHIDETKSIISFFICKYYCMTNIATKAVVNEAFNRDVYTVINAFACEYTGKHISGLIKENENIQMGNTLHKVKKTNDIATDEDIKKQYQDTIETFKN